MGKSHHFFQRRNVTMILNFGRDDTRCNFLVFINAGVKSLCTISREQQFWYIRGAEGESQNVKSSHTDPWSRLFETHCSRRWAIRKRWPNEHALSDTVRIALKNTIPQQSSLRRNLDFLCPGNGDLA